eukprot:6191608-Pleurochrysis_carterae.AAC.2
MHDLAQDLAQTDLALARLHIEVAFNGLHSDVTVASAYGRLHAAHRVHAHVSLSDGHIDGAFDPAVDLHVAPPVDVGRHVKHGGHIDGERGRCAG